MSYYLHRSSDAVATVAKNINTGESCVLCVDMVTVLSENIMMILECPGLITTHYRSTTDMNNREKVICIAVIIHVTVL